MSQQNEVINTSAPNNFKLRTDLLLYPKPAQQGESKAAHALQERNLAWMDGSKGSKIWHVDT